MAVTDQVQALADQALRQLTAMHDFFAHSQLAWDVFTVQVASGHRQTSTNPVTGTTVDEVALVQIAPRYVGQYVLRFTFREFVSIFEQYLFGLLQIVFVYNPWQFGKKNLEFNMVLHAGTREEVI